MANIVSCEIDMCEPTAEKRFEYILSNTHVNARTP